MRTFNKNAQQQLNPVGVCSNEYSSDHKKTGYFILLKVYKNNFYGLNNVRSKKRAAMLLDKIYMETGHIIIELMHKCAKLVVVFYFGSKHNSESQSKARTIPHSMHKCRITTTTLVVVAEIPFDENESFN